MQSCRKNFIDSFTIMISDVDFLPLDAHRNLSVTQADIPLPNDADENELFCEVPGRLSLLRYQEIHKLIIQTEFQEFKVHNTHFCIKDTHK